MTAQASFLEEEVLESHQQGQLSSGICREAVDMMAMSCGLRGQRGPVQILALLFVTCLAMDQSLNCLKINFLVCKTRIRMLTSQDG